MKNEKNKFKSKYTVTKAVLNRLNYLLPIEEIDGGSNFNECFKKVYN